MEYRAAFTHLLPYSFTHLKYGASGRFDQACRRPGVPEFSGAVLEKLPEIAEDFAGGEPFRRRG